MHVLRVTVHHGSVSSYISVAPVPAPRGIEHAEALVGIAPTRSVPVAVRQGRARFGVGIAAAYSYALYSYGV